MKEDVFNLELRKFLKKVGITSQREIEKSVDGALREGKLKGSEALVAVMTLEIAALGLKHQVKGKIKLA